MADTDFTLTKDYLHQIFEYKDGNLYYKKQTSPNSKIGKKVGSLTNRGYLSTTIKSKFYLLHRLIFMMFNGYTPTEIDHIDRNKLNNHYTNLRWVSRFENASEPNHKSYTITDTLTGQFLRIMMFRSSIKVLCRRIARSAEYSCGFSSLCSLSWAHTLR